MIITGYGFTGAPDYVQLYNTSDQPVDLHNFRLELTTKEKGVTELVTLKNWLAPSNYVVISSQTSVEGADFTFDKPLGATTGNVLRLASSGYAPHEVTVDKNGTYQRKKPTRTSAFESTTSPTLYGGGFYIYPTATALQVYEILAHPRMCSPLETALDCNDYVKIYNPTAETIDVSDLRLRVGYKGQSATSSNSYPLGGELSAGHYMIVTQDRDGKPISVTNSGGYVWLEDMYGIIQYDSTVQGSEDASADSRRGQAWAYDSSDGAWKWTTQPSPVDGVNVFPVVVPPVEAPQAKVYTPCEPGEYRSEDTHRCRSAASLATAVLAPCEAGEERNPATGRCRKVAVAATEKPCPTGQERNPETGRCRNVQVAATPGFSIEPMNTTKGQFMGWWTVGGVGALAAGYGVWEWRRELMSFIRKVGLFPTSGV